MNGDTTLRELEYPFDGEFILKKKKSLRKKFYREEKSFLPVKVAILGGQTTHDIKNILELFLLNIGIVPSFYESQYNMYYSDIMFPNPELESFAPDIIYFCTCIRNIKEYPNIEDSAEDVEKKRRNIYETYESMWIRASQVYHCPIIQNNFEYPFFRIMGNKDVVDIHGRVNFVNGVNQLFYEYAQQHENFYIYDVNYASSCYGLDKWSDPYYWYMYKYAVCVPAIPYYAYGLSSIVKAIYGKNKKVLMLDMDNTLWGGVIGEDGVEDIEIGQETPSGQSFAEFQEYVKAQKQLGVLLAVNSKNDFDVAVKGLQRVDSVLKEDDFVAIEANWQSKDVNLTNVARQLNVGADSFVFVDDNPAEREIVRQNVPGAAVPEMADPEHYIQILDRGGYFEVTQISEDDLKRNEMYKANALRAKEEARYMDYGSYLLSLQMQAEIRPFTGMYMSRIAQLTNKSNQFNLTSRRYSQEELEEYAKDPNYITLYGRLIDKFGDNGIVSVIMGRRKERELHIELWLMSCRVLKRDMEFAMMDALVEQCIQQGVCTIYGYYYPTEKNHIVRDFYELQGFKKIAEDENGNTSWKYEIEVGVEKKNHVIIVNNGI